MTMQRTMWVAIVALFALSGAARAQGMRVVGRSDLGGAGLNGDMTIVGTTAIVAAGLGMTLDGGVLSVSLEAPWSRRGSTGGSSR